VFKANKNQDTKTQHHKILTAKPYICQNFRMNKIFLNLAFLLATTLLLSSCVTHDELLNFTEGPEFPGSPVDIQNLPQLEIQPDDLLSIRVRALDPVAAEPFNVDPLGMNMNMNMGGGGMRPLIGFLVSRDGTIDFPILGTVKVIGMTTDELKELLLEELDPFLKDPVVLVRFLNFRITVLGEVLAPGTYFVAQERVTLLDMLGMAGDITPYGNRTNVLVIREQNGKRVTARMDLQQRDLFESPFFYLQQNDVIYVEPLPTRTASIRDQSQRILPWLSAITALTTLALTLSNL
jgi:polysaccharide biosynthesis/export protein